MSLNEVPTAIIASHTSGREQHRSYSEWLNGLVTGRELKLSSPWLRRDQTANDGLETLGGRDREAHELG